MQYQLVSFWTNSKDSKLSDLSLPFSVIIDNKIIDDDACGWKIWIFPTAIFIFQLDQLFPIRLFNLNLCSGLAVFCIFFSVMYFYRIYWVNVVLGGLCTFCYAMTIPIYFNLGGEITFPTGEAHSECYHLKTENRLESSPEVVHQTLFFFVFTNITSVEKNYSVEILCDLL